MKEMIEPSSILVLIMCLLIVVLFLVIFSHRKTDKKVDDIYGSIHNDQGESIVKKTYELADKIFEKIENFHSKK